MKTRIAWQVLATLPAAILAMQPTAEAADDEVVIGFAIGRERLDEASATRVGYGLAALGGHFEAPAVAVHAHHRPA
jgi:hypothetical protein